MPKTILVKLNKKEVEVKAGITIFKLLEEYSDILTCKNPPIGATVNNRIVGLFHRIHSPCTVEPFDITNQYGRMIMRATACLILYASMKELYPYWDLEIGQSIERGYFFEIKKHNNNVQDTPNSEEELSAIASKLQAKMTEIIQSDIVLRPVLVATDAAREYFKKAKRSDKMTLLRTQIKPEIEWIILRKFRDILHQPIAPKTSYVKNVSLHAYPPGILLRFPTKEGKVATNITPAKKLFQIYRETKQWNELVGVGNVGLLNQRCLNGEISEVIKIAEALHEKKIAYIADTIKDKMQKINDRQLVLIAGPSSSGKTTFSKRLAIQLMVNGMKPVVISLDNYYVDREKTPKHSDGSYDYEHINALDLDLFNKHLNKLLAGEMVETPVYNFQTGKRNPHKTIPLKLNKNQILITEGIHGLNEELTKEIPQDRKFKIYVSALTQLCIDDHNRIATSDTRLIRRIVRDHKYRGYSAEETISLWPSVELGSSKWIFPFQEQADIMFNSALIYEHAVLAPYAIRFLLEVSPEKPEYKEAFRLLKFLELFVPIFAEEVPPTSILREFIGGSSFHY